DGADDQAMFRVQGQVVPAIPAQVIGGGGGGAVLLPFADERPLLVELDLARVGGKRPRVRRGVAGLAHPPTGKSGSPCSCSRRPTGRFAAPHNRPRCARAASRPCPLASGSRTVACPCVPRSGSYR